MNKTTFLGFLISKNGLEIDPKKINTVLNWETPKCVKDMQCFLGFPNFYQHFICQYSCLCQPVFNLLRKDVPFQWDSSCDEVFAWLKKAFTEASVSCHFNPELETILETDASNYVVSSVLSQKHLKDGKLVLHPIAYMSEKMSPAECNYGIGDKELLAIIITLEKWYIYLHALPHPFTMFTNHHNLQTFASKALLSHCQAYWAQERTQYEFKIVFCPGALRGKADALTHRFGDLPKQGDNHGHPVQALIPPERFFLSLISTLYNQDIRDSMTTDKLA